METKTDITQSINAIDKASYRRQLITIFLDEQPGNQDLTTKYCYYVDNLQDGNRIYLKRPTALNKGMDFEVRIENTQFRYGKYGNIISTGNRPSHNDIENDLQEKKEENPVEFQQLRGLLDKTYNCQAISDAEYTSYSFNSGHSVEKIFKALKWLFIEQDITYWNRSGRAMLFDGLYQIWQD